jgi:transcriptional regulator GlxA family with amidase domain
MKRHDAPMKEPRRVVIVIFPGVQPIDAIGPGEVFRTASRIDPPGYSVELVAADPGPVRSTTVGLAVDRTLAGCRGPIDTLVVAGGTGVPAAREDRRLVSWLGSAAKRSRRVCSVCTGTFLLGEAGLLEGRRVTTHWASCDLLAGEYPSVTVEPDRIYVRDGDLYTSAGVTAGMDLALALVEADLGRATALETARWLVVFVKRPGGQSQFSAQLAAQTAEREPLRELQDWIAGNLDADLSVPALAERAHMSERNFARAFRRELGMTPGAYVETARVEAARMALESSDTHVEIVARRNGFGTVETMRRAFHRRLGVAPADYRARFKSPKAA